LNPLLHNELFTVNSNRLIRRSVNRYYENNFHDDIKPLSEELEQKDKKQMDIHYGSRKKRDSTRYLSQGNSDLPSCCIYIDTVFHILEDRRGKSDASELWTMRHIEKEVDSINEDFEQNTPFRFKLREVTRRMASTMMRLIIFLKH